MTSRAKKTIFYSIGGLILLVGVGIWVVLTYYINDIINDTVVPRLEESVRSSTNGDYYLTLGKVNYSNGTLFCPNFNLERVNYDSAASGLNVRRVTIDTVLFVGVNWWDLLWGRGVIAKRMEVNSPKLYMIDIVNGYVDSSIKKPEPKVSLVSQLPKPLPRISFDSIILNNIAFFLPDQKTNQPSKRLDGASIRFADFLIGVDTTGASKRLMFSKHVDFTIPKINYAMDDSMYSIKLRNLHCDLTDSLITIDSLLYDPNYSEDEFRERNKYVRGRLTGHFTDIRVEGINFAKLFAQSSLRLRTARVGDWSMDYYSDKRHPRDPHPPIADMPNQLIGGAKMKFDIDSLILGNGAISVRNRPIGSIQTGILTFQKTRVVLHPISNDSTSRFYKLPTRISATCLFVNQMSFDATIDYPLFSPTFDLVIEARTGKLDVKRLNTYLIPVERKELTEGTVDNADIRMVIRNGVATTSLTPRYHDLSMKVLSDKPKESRGILEGIKTFLGNLLVLKSNNMDKPGKRALTSTTTLRRAKTSEFFEFLWLALRKSIGHLVGGFD